MSPIQVGDMIPDFSLKDQNGHLFDISTVRGNKKIVIFFYPQDGSQTDVMRHVDEALKICLLLKRTDATAP